MEQLDPFWYLDDGFLIGDATAVATAFNHLVNCGPSIGLSVSLTKSFLVVNPDTADTVLPLLTRRIPRTDVVLLGACVGSQEKIDAHLGRIVDAVVQHAAGVACLGIDHPHEAYILLRICGGFSILSYFARTHGYSPAFDRADQAILSAFEKCIAQAGDETTRIQISLPSRLGGCGFRRLKDHANAANVASISAAMNPWSRRGERGSLANSTVPTAQQQQPSTQRQLSREIDQSILERLRAKLTDEGRARLLSLSAPTVSLYLNPTPSTIAHALMPADEFRTTILLRLGLQLTADSHKCRQCGKQVADVSGRHSLCCMEGGYRTRAHNALRDCLNGIASAGLLHPIKEWPAFPRSGERMDLVFFREGRQVLADIAIVYPLRDGLLTDSLKSPGGGATAYEEVKRAKYLHQVNLQAQELAPVVFDTFGACGSAARPIVDFIVNAYIKAKDLGSYGRSIALTQINRCVLRNVARLALTNM